MTLKGIITVKPLNWFQQNLIFRLFLHVKFNSITTITTATTATAAATTTITTASTATTATNSATNSEKGR